MMLEMVDWKFDMAFRYYIKCGLQGVIVVRSMAEEGKGRKG